MEEDQKADLPFIQSLSESFRFFFLKFSEIQITWLQIQIFCAIEKFYFGSQIQILFFIFRFFLTFIQILCQIKVGRSEKGKEGE